MPFVNPTRACLDVQYITGAYDDRNPAIEAIISTTPGLSRPSTARMAILVSFSTCEILISSAL